MPKVPFDQLKSRQKRQIFTVCCELFAQKGFAHTSIKMITRRLHVADGYLYYYFNGKTDIAGWVLEQGMMLWQDHYNTNVACHKPNDIFQLFRLCVHQTFAFIQKHNEVYGAYFQLTNEPNFPLAKQMHNEVSWIDQIFRQAIRSGIEQGRLRADIPENLIVMLFDCLNARMHEFYYNPKLDPIGISAMDEDKLNAYLEKVILMLREGVGATR
jgi:AcrR family transcriptional regulator